MARFHKKETIETIPYHFDQEAKSNRPSVPIPILWWKCTEKFRKHSAQFASSKISKSASNDRLDISLANML